jgi:hypothetical protein
MTTGDYFAFEEVMHELQVDEDELKRMVSEGELRAFRSENKMKFKKEDVENLKKGRVSEPTVILPSTPTPPQGMPAVDDTALELELGADVVQERKPTEDLVPSGKTSGDEPLVFDEAEVGREPVAPIPEMAPDETFAEEEEVAVSPETEPLKLAEDTGEITEEAVTVAEPAVQQRRARQPRAVPGQIPAYVEAQIEKRRAHWIWTVVMCITLIATLYYGMVLYDHLRFSTGKIERPSRVTDGLVQYILKSYWQDERWPDFHKLEYPKDVKNPEKNVEPPFAKVHRDYDYWWGFPAYEEPDRPISKEELDKFRDELRKARGIEEPAAEGESPQ